MLGFERRSKIDQINPVDDEEDIVFDARRLTERQLISNNTKTAITGSLDFKPTVIQKSFDGIEKKDSFEEAAKKLEDLVRPQTAIDRSVQVDDLKGNKLPSIDSHLRRVDEKIKE